ncbi:hypothetical protein V6N13_092771 [Hibiscus sabdariffa]
MVIALANDKGKPPNWQDFVGIDCLLVINSTISFIEENNVGNVVVALMIGLAPKTKVLRNGKWSEKEATILVPGDIISTNWETLSMSMPVFFKSEIEAVVIATSVHTFFRKAEHLVDSTNQV